MGVRKRFGAPHLALGAIFCAANVCSAGRARGGPFPRRQSSNSIGSCVSTSHRRTSQKLKRLKPPFLLSQRWLASICQTRGGSTDGAEVAVEGADVTTLENLAGPDETSAENVTEAAEENPNAGLILDFSPTRSGDGSEDDPDGIPTKFLSMKKGDREGAKEAWDTHLAWRDEIQVGSLLGRPHAKYDICKAMLPHYFAGRDPHGNVVFVQKPAMVNFKLARNNNTTMDELLVHYVYVIEYCWNILDPEIDRVMTSVLDMRGLSFRSMKNQEYVSFGKKFVSMMSANYPGRSYKTLVINAPKWFHMLYKIFKPLLRESTRRKIVILKAGPKQDSALKFYLGDCMPKDLLSASEDDEDSGDNASGEDEGDGKEGPYQFFLPVDDKELCEPGPNSLIEFEMRQFGINQLKLTNSTLQEIV